MPTSFQSFNPGDLIEDTHVEQFIEPIQNLESGKPWYGVDTGSTNAFEIDLTPAPLAYNEGMIVHFKAGNTVSGPATIVINGLGAKSIRKEDGVALASGDILSDQMVSAVYDGTEFRLISAAMTATPAPSLSENVLVYSAVTPEQTSATVTTLSLPNFNFDPSKTYILEGSLATTSAASLTRVEISDGTNTYSYPGASTSITRGPNYGTMKFYKMLPNLSGTHAVVVKANHLAFSEIRISEVHDNLVYADFAPLNSSVNFVTTTLANFTAMSGHRYLLAVTAGPHGASTGGASVYLDNGAIVGIPNSSPNAAAFTIPGYQGQLDCSTILTGLSGTCQVYARGKFTGSISVRIFDIT